MPLNTLVVQKQRITLREAQVLLCCADGLTTVAISDKLFISAHTVKRHRDNLRERFRLKGHHSLHLFAQQIKPELQKWVE